MKKVMDYLWDNKFIISIVIAVIIFLVSSNKEQLTNQSFILDNIIVNDSCKNITPVKLFKLFNNDLDLMTNTMIQNGFTSFDLSIKDNYPKIATYLERKNIISCKDA